MRGAKFVHVGVTEFDVAPLVCSAHGPITACRCSALPGFIRKLWFSQGRQVGSSPSAMGTAATVRLDILEVACHEAATGDQDGGLELPGLAV